jgi:ParB family chromosome partitioning protein
MTQHRTGQRRGLGRGLGSLIPTAPPAAAPTPEPAPTPGADSTSSVPVGDGESTSVTASTAAEPDASEPAGGEPGTPEPLAPETPEGLAPVDGAYFAELDVTAITPNPRQPRQVFEEEALAELVHSVKEIGLLQPVVVRRTGDNSYELIMGERRWRAIQEAGLSTIPAIVRETSDDAMLRDALLENLHRSQLNPLEEAAAYQQLLDDFGCTHEELAGRIGRSRPQISNTLRLLKLSPAVQRRVAAGVLSAGHARALLAVSNPETQDRLAARVVSEGISVRGLEEIVAVGDLGSENKPRPRSRKPHAPALDDLAGRLSDRLETRVKVDLGKTKGKITVEFASIPDLERIVAILDPKNDRPV